MNDISNFVDLDQLRDIWPFWMLSDTPTTRELTPGVKVTSGKHGEIDAGSLDGIILQLMRWIVQKGDLAQRDHGRKLTDDFILAHPICFASEDVLDSLISYYRQPVIPAATLGPQERDKFIWKSKRPIIVFLKRWLTLSYFPHFEDRRSHQPLPSEAIVNFALLGQPADDIFRVDTPLKQKLLAFLSSLQQKADPVYRELEAVMKFSSNDRVRYFPYFDHPDTLPKPTKVKYAHQERSKRPVKHLAPGFSLLDLSYEEIADHLFRLHYSFYTALSAADFLNIESVRYQSYILHGDRLYSFVSSSIFSEPSSKNREALLNNWIKIAHLSFQMNNINATANIVMGICIFYQQLARAFAKLPPRTVENWEKIRHLLPTNENGKYLRDCHLDLLQRNQPALPFLGVLKNDLARIFENSPKTVAISGMVNFHRIQQVGENINQLIRFQRLLQAHPPPPFENERARTVSQFLYDLPINLTFIECCEKAKFYNLSLQ